MIRRNPTRIELKMEDMQEYQQKKEEEENKKHSDNLMSSSPPFHSDIAGIVKKPSIETIHDRIGLTSQNKH